PSTPSRSHSKTDQPARFDERRFGMNPAWRALMEKRAADVRARSLVRAWEYRQRDHAKGTWFRLRRALTDASRVYAISEVQAASLAARGLAPLRVGRQLHPERSLYWVETADLAELGEVREVAVHLETVLREPF